MSIRELADHLNRNGFETSHGTEYAGGRGTANLISQTYKFFECLGLKDEEAKKVALAFVKEDGSYAWKNE